MKPFLSFLLLLAVTVAALPAQEKVTLSAPVFQSTGVTDFRVASIYLKRDLGPNSPAEIRAIFAEVSGTTFVPNGRTLTCRYDDAAAEPLLRGLNKADLAVKSLERRVTERCQQDGKLGAGTVSGSPQ